MLSTIQDLKVFIQLKWIHLPWDYQWSRQRSRSFKATNQTWEQPFWCGMLKKYHCFNHIAHDSWFIVNRIMEFSHFFRFFWQVFLCVKSLFLCVSFLPILDFTNLAWNYRETPSSQLLGEKHEKLLPCDRPFLYKNIF